MEEKRCNLALSDKVKLIKLGVPKQFLDLDGLDFASLYKKLKSPMNSGAHSLKIKEQWQIDVLTGNFDYSNFSNPNSRDNIEAYLPHYAAWSGDLPLLKVIEQNSPLLVTKKDGRKRHLGYYAIVDGHLKVIEWLFQKYPELFNENDTFGITMAQWAIMHQQFKILDWLWENLNVDDLHCEDYNKNKLLDYALAYQDPRMFRHVWSLIGRPSSIQFTLGCMGSYRPSFDFIGPSLIEYLANNFSISTVSFNGQKPSGLWKANIDAQLTLNKINHTNFSKWLLFMDCLKNPCFNDIGFLILNLLVSNSEPTAKSTALCKIGLEIDRLKACKNHEKSIESLKNLIERIKNPQHSLSEEIEIWQKENQKIINMDKPWYSTTLHFFNIESKTEIELLIENVKKVLSTEPNYSIARQQL